MTGNIQRHHAGESTGWKDGGKNERGIRGRTAGFQKRKKHSFRQRPFHPSFGRVIHVVDGYKYGWTGENRAKVFPNDKYCKFCLKCVCK